MQSLSRYPWYFLELEQIISQFVWKNKKPQIAKAILRKKNGTGGINLPFFYFNLSFQSSFHLSQHQGLCQWVCSSHQVTKVLEFQLQLQFFQWISGLVSFRTDWFDLLAGLSQKKKIMCAIVYTHNYIYVCSVASVLSDSLGPYGL